MLREPLLKQVIIYQRGGVRIWVLRNPGGLIIGICVARSDSFIVDQAEGFIPSPW